MIRGAPSPPPKKKQKKTNIFFGKSCSLHIPIEALAGGVVWKSVDGKELPDVIFYDNNVRVVDEGDLSVQVAEHIIPPSLRPAALPGAWQLRCSRQGPSEVLYNYKSNTGTGYYPSMVKGITMSSDHCSHLSLSTGPLQGAPRSAAVIRGVPEASSF